ncbi:MAG TPA: hypothetical protein VIO61_12580 [Anaerolineaceae bacterium]
MTKWEYKTIIINADCKYATEVDVNTGQVVSWGNLDELGEKGWELVSTPWVRQEVAVALAVFKRQRSE